ncbi:hypothetical protein [Candidatus Amarolinea dominans]|uniref:hypothetical protein n=1 Tax=Candidatus Amarolinea dominans TaxID=3140696 RepID=UPI001D827F52|nr:hypothetical protein [Anaerolineae bacterium]
MTYDLSFRTDKADHVKENGADYIRVGKVLDFTDLGDVINFSAITISLGLNIRNAP